MRKTLFSLSLLCSVLALGLMFSSARRRPITFFMVGDSTMADKTELDISPERGWGQLFPSFLTGDVVVQNHAMNGRATKSFVDEGRWQVVLDRIHRGDVVILEFGHNDAKVEDPKRYSSVDQYADNLVRMTREAQKRGASVMIATPISRRYFKDGVFHRRHGGYPDAARRAAQQAGVPLLDLEESTAQWIMGLGDEASRAYFMNVPAGECIKFPEGKTDNTHLRENGALVVGRMAAQMIVDQKIKPLCRYIHIEDNPQPVYTTFCRPEFRSDKTVRQESDMKSFKE